MEALTKPQRAALRVEAGLPDAVAIVRTMPVPHDIPIRVLTAGKPWWPKADENRAWRKSHEHLAASVKNGELLVAENSAHLIPYEQPEILVAAVKELVQDARRARALNDLVCAVYEEELPLEGITVQEPLRSWLIEHVSAKE